MRIVVTGASGFIGSAFVRRALRLTDHTLVGLVRHTDERNLMRLTHDIPVKSARDSGRLRLVNGDLNGDLSGLCEHADAVVHFAGRTFVDHAIRHPLPFVEANVIGTHNILEDARRYKVHRYFQVSTDEVYGSILEGAYTEDARLNPTNVYSASKAGGDCLAIAYAHSFGLHTTVTRTENNMGPYQHPQKAFPVFVGKAMRKEPLPVYGDGGHVRQWLWVDDHVDAILHLLSLDYAPGEVFHIAGNQEITNLELSRKIIKQLWPDMQNPDELIRFVPDHDIRPGHDRRYALDCTKLKATGWQPKVLLAEGIQMTVEWYRNNQWWTR